MICSRFQPILKIPCGCHATALRRYLTVSTSMLLHELRGLKINNLEQTPSGVRPFSKHGGERGRQREEVREKKERRRKRESVRERKRQRRGKEWEARMEKVREGRTYS